MSAWVLGMSAATFGLDILLRAPSDGPSTKGYTVVCRTSNSVAEQIYLMNRDTMSVSSGGPPRKWNTGLLSSNWTSLPRVSLYGHSEILSDVMLVIWFCANLYCVFRWILLCLLTFMLCSMEYVGDLCDFFMCFCLFVNYMCAVDIQLAVWPNNPKPRRKIMARIEFNHRSIGVWLL